jgi:tetratricopeptide (TPR) repeat protein
MEPQDIRKQYHATRELLRSGQLCQALTKLLEQTRRSHHADLIDQVSERIVAYNYLLTYLKNGSNDPMRDGMYDKIVEEAYHINDLWADRLLEASDEESCYYIQRRRLRGLVPADQSETTLLRYLHSQLMALSTQLDNTDASQLETQKAIEELLDNCFNAVWTTFPSDGTDVVIMVQLMLLPTLTPGQRSLMLSALTLSCLERFEPIKVELILDRIVDGESADVEFRQRAWIGLVLILMVYGDRITHCERLMSRLERVRQAYQREEGNLLTVIQILIYQAFDATRAEECFEQHISPALHRHFTSRSEGGEEVTVIRLDARTAAGSKLSKSLREFMELQREGADVMFRVFKDLHHAPFFRRMTSWLRPYESTHPEVASRCQRHPGLQQMADRMEQASQLCSTDKYSFLIGFSTLPEEQCKKLDSTLHEQMGDGRLEEQLDSRMLDMVHTEQAARGYIHDLYRLYSLHPKREQWVNPFRADIHLCRNAVLRTWFGRDEQEVFATYLFKKRRYAEAYQMYTLLYEAHTATPTKELLQRYAYSAYVKKEPDRLQAERLLMESNRLYPGDEWTLRFLANCYIKRKSYAEAATLLDEALIHHPGHYDLLIEMAQCLLKNKDYDLALTYLYQAEVMGENEQDATRVVAWCHVLRRDWVKAEAYARKMMELGGKPIDWVNAGLVALAQGDCPTAIARFSGSFKTEKPWTTAEYAAYFRRIEPDLLEHGYNQTLLIYTRDAALMAEAFPK